MNFNGIMQASILALACLTAVGSASAEIRNQAFRWTTTNPSGHPVVKGGLKFSELVAEKSGGKMIVIEVFVRWRQPRAPPSAAVPIRTIAS